MICAACTLENPSPNRFCGRCGAALARTCPACGRPNSPDHGFCGGCGGTLGDVRAAAPPPRDPRAYTPKHLAEKILASKSALEGERKQVTVLFADVKGSMDLAESIDAEDWHTILERFFARLTAVVPSATSLGTAALMGAMRIGPLRRGFSRRLPQSGDGPSVQKRDPGYGSTSRMLGESAVCLAKDAISVAGGCWTPASAMGEPLLVRLGKNAGVTFEIE